MFAEQPQPGLSFSCSPARAGRALVVTLLMIVLAAGVAGVVLAVRNASKPEAPRPVPSPQPAPVVGPAEQPESGLPQGAAAAPGGATSSASAPLATPTQPLTPERSRALDAALNAAVQAQNQGQWDQAQALLAATVKDYPDQQSPYVEHARVLSVLGRHAEAYAQFERALAIGPRTFELELAAGTSAQQASRPDRAIEHLGQAQVLKPGDWQPPLLLGQLYARRNQLPEAQKNLLVAAQLKPDLGVAWGTLADVALRQNAANVALQHVEKARSLEPGVVLWRVVEGRALKRLGRPEEALQLLVGLSPEEKLQPGVLTLMGECFGLLRRPADMAREASALADQFRTDGALALEAARWLERAGDVPNAQRLAQRAKLMGTPGADELAQRLGTAVAPSQDPNQDPSPAPSQTQGTPGQPRR